MKPEQAPRLIPIKASEWILFEPAYKEILIANGAIPVNDVFFENWGNQWDIDFLYGGFGSGKSVWKATQLIVKCLTTKHFKCFYGRKVKDKVRESVFATLRETIEDLGLKRFFKYSEAPTGTMVIQCRDKNKGLFIPFGCDDPESMKSIKDPSDIWCEEMDQFTVKDFQELYPRLRTSKAVTQFHGTFNTGPVFPEHWIKKLLFSEDNPFDGMGFDIKDLIHTTFANYTENYFIDQKEYYKKLVISSGGNQTLLDAMASGHWGVKENKAPWLYSFSKEKHVKKTIPLLHSFPVYLSFDFNREPMSCVAMQMSPQQGLKGSFVHFIQEFKADVQLSELCQRIKTRFPAQVLFVTGDASGNKGDVSMEKRNSTYYTLIKSYLKLTDKLMNLNTTNLEHNDSRILCNTMLYNYPNVFISEEGCPTLVQDCLIAEVDDKKPKPGHLKKDRELFKMDVFDAFRYHLQTHFLSFVRKFYLNPAKNPNKLPQKQAA